MVEAAAKAAVVKSAAAGSDEQAKAKSLGLGCTRGDGSGSSSRSVTFTLPKGRDASSGADRAPPRLFPMPPTARPTT